MKISTNNPSLFTWILLISFPVPVKTEESSCMSCTNYCSKTSEFNRTVCSCSYRCLAWDNCCADFLQVCTNYTEDDASYLATVEADANDAVELLSRYGECISYSNVGYTKVVGQCLSQYDDYFNKNCSEKPKHLFPVRHKNNLLLNFANIHCALCHGYNVTDVTPWDFNYICPANNVTNLESIKKECKISFLERRPEELICYPFDKPSNIPSVLNDTELHLLCRHTLEPVGFKHIIYKNKYCAQLDGVNESLSCLKPVYKVDTRPTPTSLTVLFDMHKGTANVEDETVRLCSVNHIYDPFLSICREFFCPTYHYPKWGKCYPNETLFIESNIQPFPDLNGTINIHFTYHFIDAIFLEGVLTTDYISETLVSEPVLDPNPLANCQLEPKSDIKRTEVTYVVKGEISTNDTNYLLRMISYSPCVSKTTLSNMASGEVACVEGYHVQMYNNVQLKMVDNELFAMVELKDQTFFYQLLSIGFQLPIHEYLTIGRATEIHVCKQNSSLTLTCPTIVLKSDEFEQQNDTIVVNNRDKVIPEDQYRIIDGEAHVCEFLLSMKLQFFKFDEYQQLVSIIVTGISNFCLLFCLFVYIRFKEMQTLSGKMNACLCLWLLLAQLTLMIHGFEYLVCRVVATICHFLWLAVFSQMSAIAATMALTFHKMAPVVSGDTGTRFKGLTIAALIPPVLIIAVCTGLDVGLTDGVWRIGYGTSICAWISVDMETIVIFFYTPVCISMFINFVCFVITLRGIEKSTNDSLMVSHDTTRSERRRCVIYAKLSSIMGFTWITGIIAAILDIPALWYIFIILNGLQGFFIFLSFICNRRTASMLRRVFEADRKKLYTFSTKPESNSAAKY